MWRVEIPKAWTSPFCPDSYYEEWVNIETLNHEDSWEQMQMPLPWFAYKRWHQEWKVLQDSKQERMMNGRVLKWEGDEHGEALGVSSARWHLSSLLMSYWRRRKPHWFYSQSWNGKVFQVQIERVMWGGRPREGFQGLENYWPAPGFCK